MTSSLSEKKQRQLQKMLQTYLMTGYLYYIMNKSAISDSEFDQIAKILLAHWDEFDHPHKYLLDKEDLAATTLYRVREDQYPLVIKHAADIMARELKI
jgi:NAD-dependent DNA ligase